VALEIEGSNPSVHPTKIFPSAAAMNEEAVPEAQAAPDSTEPSTQDTVAPVGGGLPPWLPYLALAIVPAVIVGILVYVFAGSTGGGTGYAPGIVEGLLRLTPDSNTQVDSYKGELPPDLPTDIPMFAGADPVVSFSIVTASGTNFFVVLTTPASADDVYSYYRKQLDNDPWQVEIGQTGSQITGIQFTRPDNADVSGVLTVHHSDLDNITSILLTYEDVAAALAPGTGPSIPLLSQSRPLPPGFPSEVPVYGSDNGSIVIDSYFQRGQGSQLFAITFVTKDSADDVINYYKDEMGAKNWTVTDSVPTETNTFAVGVDFDDGTGNLSGQITADTYEEDASYTRVDLVVQAAGANNGN
jgi:hypothetical protein